jgi:hypothetical protein
MKPVLKLYEINPKSLIDPDAYSFLYHTDDGVVFKAENLCLRKIKVFNAPKDKKKLMISYGEMIGFFVINYYPRLNHFPGFSSISIDTISSKEDPDG